MASTTAKGDITTALAADEAGAQATALHRQGYGIVKVGAYLRLEAPTRAPTCAWRPPRGRGSMPASDASCWPSAIR